MLEQMKPFVLPNMQNEDYHNCEGLSKSALWLMRTPALYHYEYIMGIDEETGEIAAVESSPIQGELFPVKSAPPVEDVDGNKIITLRRQA